jgi:glycosyltransferase involved in cell wall biosynthesis
MRVVWDVTGLALPATGIGRYVIGAMHGVALARPEWEIVAVAVEHESGIESVRRQLEGAPANVSVCAKATRAAVVERRLAGALRWPSAERYAGGSFDAFIPSDWFQPAQRDGARLAVIYDLIPLLYPQWVPWLTRKAHLRMYRECQRRLDRTIAISEYTKHEMVEHLSVDSDRIAVAYPGIGEEYRNATAASPREVNGRPYIVAVGTTNERKNLLRLIEAYALLATRHPDIDLVIVGAAASADEAIAAAGHRLAIGSRIHRLGYVPDRDLAGIVAAARALVFPSLFEGFGMPVVEAMAVSVPVAASAHPSLDEACGNAAERFDPLDVDAMAQSIEGLLDSEDVRQRAIERGVVHARGFTWEAAGQAIASAIDDVVVASTRSVGR